MGLALLVLACEARPPTRDTTSIEASASGPLPVGARSRAPSAASAPGSEVKVGAPVPAGAATPLGDILSAPQDFSGKTVLVEGDVRRACSKKGCWMELATSTEPNASGCRVTFKDYSFFVPTDSAGSHARLSGEVVVKTLRKSHVDHLEAEGARFASKNPDGSAWEVQVVATGVELRKS